MQFVGTANQQRVTGLFSVMTVYMANLEGLMGREGQQEQGLEAEDLVVFARPNIFGLG